MVMSNNRWCSHTLQQPRSVHVHSVYMELQLCSLDHSKLTVLHTDVFLQR